MPEDPQIIVRRNGPYRVSGPVKVIDVDDNDFEKPGEIFALCRCGHSEEKPFCDGHHKEIGFQDESLATPRSTDHRAANSSEVTILVRANGPYRIYGPARLLDPDGAEFEVPDGEWYTLCRCGHSQTKPFCDSTHKTIDFHPETRVAATG